jgi:hypothetical protein
MGTLHREFWQKHPGLVWSNPGVDDSVRIRAALMRPRFSLLLSIAVEFGLERLGQEWSELLGDSTLNTGRVRDPVERALTNIEKGFARAASGWRS